MGQLPMTFACGLYDRMLALYTGEVRPQGIDLEFLINDNPRNIFDRMAGGLEFDACEFSSSEFIARYAAGKCPFVAIPVFASRVFRHSFIFVNRKFIKSPKDLEGKRIGVPRFGMTAAIFMRGLLGDEYGVDFSRVEWIEGDINSAQPHGTPAILPPVKPVSIVQNTSGQSLNSLLERGEIQALLGTGVPDALGRHPDVERLYPSYREAEQDYFRRTRIFPIMHLIAFRRDLYEQHRFVADSLFNAFEKAKAIAFEKLRYRGTLRAMLPWMLAEIDEIEKVFGGDPWPYGIEPNRPTLEALARYMVEQGLIAAPVKVDDLFVPIDAGH
jgi:4,5-dihydroxyphthalate decarboxylase